MEKGDKKEPKPWEQPKRQMGDWGDDPEDFERKWQIRDRQQPKWDDYTSRSYNERNNY